MTFENLNVLIVEDIEENNVPMLVGEPGIGKSSFVEGLAEFLKTKCFTLPINQIADKADLTGCRLVPYGTDANGNPKYSQQFYPHTVIMQAIEYALAHPNETPILFLDEINRSTPDVTSEALSIPTLRSIGDVKIPDNLKVIVAGNDKGNVCSLDKASITRFVMYHIQPDCGTFMKVNPSLNPHVANVLRRHPNYVYCEAMTVEGDDDDDDDDAAVMETDFEDALEQMSTPRTITSVSRWLNKYTDTQLMSMQATAAGDGTLLEEALYAHAGHTEFTLALLEDIISNPVANNAPVSVDPVEPALYAKLSQATSRQELEDAITAMTEDEKGEMLVWCLFNKTDNSRILDVLAPEIKSIPSNMFKQIGDLAADKKLDRENFDHVSMMSCNISQLMSMISM